MNISTASALIGAAYEDGQTAARAQDAIRARSYYGNRMTAADRRRIVDTETPVNALLARVTV